MTKILNWTFGACFRTLGRFLAIFIVGVLLVFIGSKIGIEMPSWLALNVKASWVPGWAETLPAPTNVIYYECNGANSCPKVYNTYVDYFSSPVTTRGFVTTDEAMAIGTNGYAIQYPTSTLKKDYIYNVNYYICANKTFSATNFSIYSSGYQKFTNNNIYNSITRSSIGTEPVIDGGRAFNSCQFFSGLLVPEQDTTWVTFRIKKSETTISSIYLSTISVEVKELGLYNSALEDVIKNSGFATSESVEQVQQSVNKVEEEIKETQDTITNGDITGAEDSASGFFNDFKSEDFGLSSIVTAPLRGINAMLSDTCIAPSATYKGQTFSLPCGSMLWSRPGGEDFKSFLNVMYGGFLAYLVIRKFFLDVENLKNPNSDKVEVDKL